METVEHFKIGTCSVELVNFEMMRKIFDKYGSKLGTKNYYRILTYSAQITQQYLKRNTPIGTKDVTKSRKIYTKGTLLRSVGIRPSRTNNQRNFAIWVGYRTDKRKIKIDAWFRHFQEGGTNERFQVGRTIKGKYVRYNTPKSLGKMPRTRLMETAWDATKAQVESYMKEHLDIYLNKVWNGKDWV